MTYLIAKMALYLLAALACGGIAGWLLRNLSAVKGEEDWQRARADLEAQLRQFESLMRSRDAQLTELRSELKQKEGRIRELRASVERAPQSPAPAEKAAPGAPNAGELEAAQTRIAELSAELARLHSQLSDARVRAAAAEMSRGSGSGMEEELRGQLGALESELGHNRQEAERLQKKLEQERRKVVELERERELQSKSLQLLHEQLDLERARTAGGASV